MMSTEEEVILDRANDANDDPVLILPETVEVALSVDEQTQADQGEIEVVEVITNVKSTKIHETLRERNRKNKAYASQCETSLAAQKAKEAELERQRREASMIESGSLQKFNGARPKMGSSSLITPTLSRPASISSTSANSTLPKPLPKPVPSRISPATSTLPKPVPSRIPSATVTSGALEKEQEAPNSRSKEKEERVYTLQRGCTIVGPGNTPQAFIPLVSRKKNKTVAVPPGYEYIDCSKLFNNDIPMEVLPLSPDGDVCVRRLAFDLSNLYSDKLRRTDAHQSDVETLASVILNLKKHETQLREEKIQLRQKLAESVKIVENMSNPMRLLDMNLGDNPTIMEVFHNSIKSFLGLLQLGTESTKQFGVYLRTVTERRQHQNPIVGDIFNEALCRFFGGNPDNQAFIESAKSLYMYLDGYEVRRKLDKQDSNQDKQSMPPPQNPQM
jgi:hypothetical protein